VVDATVTSDGELLLGGVGVVFRDGGDGLVVRAGTRPGNVWAEDACWHPVVVRAVAGGVYRRPSRRVMQRQDLDAVAEVLEFDPRGIG